MSAHTEDLLKIILSRKGFDSSVGGGPSPILPDGAMLSLPIPTSIDRLSYDDLGAEGGRSYGQVIRELFGAECPALKKGAHLDPDLVMEARPRKPEWRASLGQIGAAAGHLSKQQIAPGDLFLFYGWFQHADPVDGRMVFRRTDRGFHALFGYLQVGAIIAAPKLGGLPEWLEDHPHALPERMKKPTNTFYVSAERLSWDRSTPGWGTFRFNKQVVLSHPEMSRSRWQLDRRIFRHLPISYHDADAWRDGYFQSYPRAQEYVVGADKGAERWARDLVLGIEKREL
jgi:hypothetical protein